MPLGLIEIEDAIVAKLRAEFDAGLIPDPAESIFPQTGTEDELESYAAPFIRVATGSGAFTQPTNGDITDLTETISIDCFARTRRNRKDGEATGDQAGAFDLVDEVFRILKGSELTLASAPTTVQPEPLNYTIGEDPVEDGFIGTIELQIVAQMEG